MLAVGVNACTDVTGFGLLGHLHEMALASGLAAEVVLGRVPVLEEAWELARQGVVPDGTHNNRHYLEGKVRWEAILREEQIVLCDAQTSGGLLIACQAERGEELETAMRRAGVEAAVIGRMARGLPGEILVTRG
ncbi:MAG: AIR synthase-related protein [Actinobacteria bacterium]|nr:AIR synthase-related protein [Actinomycetota bacterium]